LVTDLEGATRTAVGNGADVLVSPFNDPIGRDVVSQWPGGVNMQLYWHTTAPSYKPLQSIPENRVYVSAERVAAFVRSFGPSLMAKSCPMTRMHRASKSDDRTRPIG
jgi:hypothetical protein